MSFSSIRVFITGMLTTTSHGTERDGGLNAGDDGLHAFGVEEAVLGGETGGDYAEPGFDHGPVEAGGADDWWGEGLAKGT